MSQLLVFNNVNPADVGGEGFYNIQLDANIL